MNSPIRTSAQIVVQALCLLGVLSLLWIPVPSQTFLWKAANNFAHVPLFALVAILLLRVSRIWNKAATRTPLRHYRFAMAGVLAFALLTEALQSLSATRHPELSDVGRDLLGAICALGWSVTGDQQMSGKLAQWRKCPRSVMIRSCVMLILGLTLLPVAGWTYAYWDRAMRFPDFLQFSSYWEMKFVQVSDSDLHVVPPPAGWKKSAGDRVGLVVFHTKKYPGIRIAELYPDWRGYSSFQLDIFSELSRPQSMVIRIDDIHHNNEHSDRFNKVITISPGLNHIRIPIDDIRQALVGREMDLSAMKAVLLFAVNPPEAFSLYIDNVRLE